MNKLTLDLGALKVDSYATAQDPKPQPRKCSWEGWSEQSVCPTTTPSDCKACF